MALPYEGDTEFGRTGEYSLVPRNEEEAVRQVSSKARVSSSVLPEVFQQERKKRGCCEAIVDAADNFKNFVANTCCTCLQNVPSVALIICALVLVALLLATIPIVFALTYQKPQAQVGEQMINFNGEPDIVWPDDGDLSEELLHANSLLPRNVTYCPGFGFSCTNIPGIMIGTNRRCDGVSDCPDGSDELDCQSCQTSFYCYTNKDKTRKVCLRGANLCDSASPCYMRTDEEQHCRQKCLNGEFKCPDAAKCLSKEMVCDGDDHCKSGADETDCNGECNNGAKWCAISKKCIPKWKQCDGVRDCLDGSDEVDCDCKSCSGSGTMMCNTGDGKGVCISKKKVCDGKVDCPNGIDEEGCPGNCEIDSADNTTAATSMVKCADGKEYDSRYACSGRISVCDNACEKCDSESGFTCGNGKCISRKLVCDGKLHCDDGSDEKDCGCSSEHYQCKAMTLQGNHKCIPQNLLCDGFSDCPGGDDEASCKFCSNNKEAVFCDKDKKCFPSTARCDGQEDCSDGEDEKNCTCQQCSIYYGDIYMCSSGDRCVRKNAACNPHSTCPDASKEDQLYCAVKFTPKNLS